MALIPGDGIGIDMMAEATKVLHTLIAAGNLPFELRTFDGGAERLLRDGVTLPQGASDMFRREFDAIKPESGARLDVRARAWISAEMHPEKRGQPPGRDPHGGHDAGGSGFFPCASRR
jgi:hypothetical protein